MRGRFAPLLLAAPLLTLWSAGAAWAQGVCNMPGNMPRLSVSDLDFGDVPGLVGRPWEGVASLVISCPRAGDSLPRLRVVALDLGGEMLLHNPRGTARVQLLPGPGVGAAQVPGGVVVAEHAGAAGGRALFRLRARLMRERPLGPGAYTAALPLQLRLE